MGYLLPWYCLKVAQIAERSASHRRRSKRKDVAAAIGLIGERVFWDGEGSARTMPGHLEVAGASLDRRDDLGGDFGVNVSMGRLRPFRWALAHGGLRK